MKIILSSRRHYYVAIVSTFLIMVVLIAGMAGCCAPPPQNVEIQTWYDLDAVRDSLKGSYVLMKDLDDTTDGYDELVGETADGKGWQPIGTKGDAFEGEFDGNGHTISDLFIDRPDEEEVGLFGRVQDGLIENLGLENVNVTGKEFVGALVGYSHKGTLYSDTPPPNSKTYSCGSVTGENNVGGLVGNNYGGTVNQCESTAEVFHASSAPDEDRWRTGGLVGLNSGTVLHCDYNGEVNGDRQVGGLVGMNEHRLTEVGRVEDCGGEYSVNGNFEVGGVAGFNMGEIRRSSFKGDVNGIMIGDGLVALNEGTTVNAYSSDTEIPGSYIGGVVGVNGEEGIVEDCSAEATVEGYQYIGGLAGANEGTVEDCIADSNVTGISNVGGLVGANEGNIGSCSSSGDVTGDSNTGRLVGYNTGTVSNSDSTSWVTGTSDGGDLIGRDANVRYNLRVSSTSGGSVTSPGEGTFACNEGEVINLVATPDTGYQFIEWTGDVQTIANVNAASTIINTNGDYSITANFKLAPTYALTMAVDPVVTGTATDVSGASPYAAGISVSIKAVPAAGYQFVIWTAPAGKFANPSAATTTFTMPPQDVTVTAHFVGPLDHFNCYSAADERGPIFVGEVVYLEDQFGAVQAEVGYAALFCNPVEKWHDGVTPISNPDHHLTVYSLDYEEEPQTWFVGVDNQFGTQYFPTHYESQELIVSGPVGLAVPTQKEGHEPPVGLDHLLLYEVIEGPDVDVYVGLMDQFGDQAEVLVSTPVIFGIPVQKTHDGVVTEIEDPEAHLVFYWIEGGEFETKVQVVNQFGTQTLNMGGPYLLAVPSEKVYYAPFA